MMIDDAARLPPRRAPGPISVSVTVLLLAVSLAEAQIAPLLTSRAAMHAVAASTTGHGVRWATWAMTVSLIGGLALFGFVTAVAVWRMMKRRPAVGVAVTGCVLQLMLLLAAVMMTGLVE